MKKKRKGLKKKDKLGLLIIALSVIVTVAVSLGVYFLSDHVQYDEKFCPIKDLKKHTVLLIDKSDKWEDDDINRIKQLIQSTKKSIKFREKFTLNVIHGEGRGRKTEIESKFEMCSPGSKTECNQFYENCRQIQVKYDKNFTQQFKNTTRELEKPTEASSSPILESLVAIIDESVAEELKIVVISDLMENGRKFRFYDGIPLAEEMANEFPIESPAKISIKFSVIERRRHSRQLKSAVENVWREYFKTYGITSNFKRLFIAE